MRMSGVLLLAFTASADGADEAGDLRLPAARTLPQVESYQQVVFSGSVSGVPKDEGLDRLTAPPFTVVLRQSFAILDRSTGGLVL